MPNTRSKLVTNGYASILSVIMMANIVYTVHAQQKWEGEFKLGVSATKLRIDKTHPMFEDWGNVNESYKPKEGVLVGAGISRTILPKWRIMTEARYQYWGGNTNISRNGSTFFMALDITYQSLNIPLALHYKWYESDKWNWEAAAGAGMDYTYRVAFTPTTRNGELNEMKSKVDIQTYYALLRVQGGYTLNEKYGLVFGVEMQDDRLFNNERYQDFGGYFKQQRVNLNYSSVLVFIGFQL